MQTGSYTPTHCLQTLYTPQDHTAESLAVALTDTLDAWNLDPAKQACITTDNGANLCVLLLASLIGLVSLALVITYILQLEMPSKMTHK